MEWKELSDYPGGESLGHKQFWGNYFNDNIKAVKMTTFYKTMSKKGFINIKSILLEDESIIVILEK